MENDSILRWPQVAKLTNLSRTTIWRMEKEGTFPKRVKIGPHSVGWKSSDIQEWLKTLKEVEP